MMASEVQWERMFPDECESAFETGLMVYLSALWVAQALCLA